MMGVVFDMRMEQGVDASHASGLDSNMLIIASVSGCLFITLVFSCICCARRRNRYGDSLRSSRRDTVPLEDLLSKPTLADPESFFSEAPLDYKDQSQGISSCTNNDGISLASMSQLSESSMSELVNSDPGVQISVSDKKAMSDKAKRSHNFQKNALNNDLKPTSAYDGRQPNRENTEADAQTNAKITMNNVELAKQRDDEYLCKKTDNDIYNKNTNGIKGALNNKLKKTNNNDQKQKKDSLDITITDDLVSSDSFSSARGSISHDMTSSVNAFRFPRSSIVPSPEMSNDGVCGTEKSGKMPLPEVIETPPSPEEQLPNVPASPNHSSKTEIDQVTVATRISGDNDIEENEQPQKSFKSPTDHTNSSGHCSFEVKPRVQELEQQMSKNLQLMQSDGSNAKDDTSSGRIPERISLNLQIDFHFSEKPACCNNPTRSFVVCSPVSVSQDMREIPATRIDANTASDGAKHLPLQGCEDTAPYNCSSAFQVAKPDVPKRETTEDTVEICQSSGLESNDKGNKVCLPGKDDDFPNRSCLRFKDKRLSTPVNLKTRAHVNDVRVDCVEKRRFTVANLADVEVIHRKRFKLDLLCSNVIHIQPARDREDTHQSMPPEQILNSQLTDDSEKMRISPQPPSGQASDICQKTGLKDVKEECSCEPRTEMKRSDNFEMDQKSQVIGQKDNPEPTSHGSSPGHTQPVSDGSGSNGEKCNLAPPIIIIDTVEDENPSDQGTDKVSSQDLSSPQRKEDDAKPTVECSTEDRIEKTEEHPTLQQGKDAEVNAELGKVEEEKEHKETPCLEHKNAHEGSLCSDNEHGHKEPLSSEHEKGHKQPLAKEKRIIEKNGVKDLPHSENENLGGEECVRNRGKESTCEGDQNAGDHDSGSTNGDDIKAGNITENTMETKCIHNAPKKKKFLQGEKRDIKIENGNSNKTSGGQVKGETVHGQQAVNPNSNEIILRDKKVPTVKQKGVDSNKTQSAGEKENKTSRENKISYILPQRECKTVNTKGVINDNTNQKNHNDQLSTHNSQGTERHCQKKTETEQSQSEIKHETKSNHDKSADVNVDPLPHDGYFMTTGSLPTPLDLQKLYGSSNQINPLRKESTDLEEASRGKPRAKGILRNRSFDMTFKEQENINVFGSNLEKSPDETKYARKMVPLVVVSKETFIDNPTAPVNETENSSGTLSPKSTIQKTEDNGDASDESDYDNPWDSLDEAVKRGSMRYNRRSSRVNDSDAKTFMLKSAEDLGRLLEDAERRRRIRQNAVRSTCQITDSPPSSPPTFTRLSPFRHTVKGLVSHGSTKDLQDDSLKPRPLKGKKDRQKSKDDLSRDFAQPRTCGIDPNRSKTLAAVDRSKLYSPETKKRKGLLHWK